MKPIIILTTPRTGSNLLLDSLAEHPQAVTGGEVLSGTPEFNSDKALDNLRASRTINLCKIFSDQLTHPRFREFWSPECCTVHLYRRDIAAQIASWRTACETGIWTEGEPYPHPQAVPLDMHDQIAASRCLLPRYSTIAICYESLVDQWDLTIEYILRTADWDVVPLAQMRAKQT